MKVTFTLSIGYPTATRHDTLEFDDDLTDDELYQEWQTWAWEYIDGGFEREED